MDNISVEKDLKVRAERCVDILNNVKSSLIDSFKEFECLEKQKDCFQSKYDRLVLKIKPKKVEQDEDVEGIDFESWVSLDDIN